MSDDLREKLIEFANELAACQWSTSGTYEDSTEDRIRTAVEACKADIGDRLLKALGAEQVVCCYSCGTKYGIEYDACPFCHRKRQ